MSEKRTRYIADILSWSSYTRERLDRMCMRELETLHGMLIAQRMRRKQA